MILKLLVKNNTQIKGKTFIKVNDKEVILSKYSSEIIANGNDFDISICHPSIYDGNLWYFTNIFFYLISIFGIFDSKLKKNDTSFHYKNHIHIEEDTVINIQLNGNRLTHPLSFIDQSLENETNILKKHGKGKKFLLALTKGIIFVGILVLIAYLVIK